MTFKTYFNIAEKITAEIKAEFKNDNLQKIVSITIGPVFFNMEIFYKKTEEFWIKKIFGDTNIYDFITHEYEREHLPAVSWQRQGWIDSGMKPEDFL